MAATSGLCWCTGEVYCCRLWRCLQRKTYVAAPSSASVTACPTPAATTARLPVCAALQLARGGYPGSSCKRRQGVMYNYLPIVWRSAVAAIKLLGSEACVMVQSCRWKVMLPQELSPDVRACQACCMHPSIQNPCAHCGAVQAITGLLAHS